MITIKDYIERIQNAVKALKTDAERLEKHYNECDYDLLVSKAEKINRASSELFSLYRELALSLNEMVLSLERKIDIEKIECDAMGISVERLADFDFPVYRITLSMLIPNMRRRRENFRNPVTATVNAAVRRYCKENDIRPFYRALVLFLSYCDSPYTMVDNDNKESSVIMNGLIGHFIRDDSPVACDTAYYYIHEENSPKTEIYIVDTDHDIELFGMIKELE